MAEAEPTGEIGPLLAALDAQRGHVLGILEGLPDEALRRAVLHVITETACHAGHLDAVRELMDGRTWLILTG